MEEVVERARRFYFSGVVTSSPSRLSFTRLFVYQMPSHRRLRTPMHATTATRRRHRASSARHPTTAKRRAQSRRLWWMRRRTWCESLKVSHSCRDTVARGAVLPAFSHKARLTRLHCAIVTRVPRTHPNDSGRTLAKNVACRPSRIVSVTPCVPTTMWRCTALYTDVRLGGVPCVLVCLRGQMAVGAWFKCNSCSNVSRSSMCKGANRVSLHAACHVYLATAAGSSVGEWGANVPMHPRRRWSAAVCNVTNGARGVDAGIQMYERARCSSVSVVTRCSLHCTNRCRSTNNLGSRARGTCQRRGSRSVRHGPDVMTCVAPC